MRRNLLPLLVCPTLVLAQPVLESTNVDLIGHTYAVHLVTDPGTSDPSPNGANVTWDFSSASLQLNVGSATYVVPAATPFAAAYPTSNMASQIILPGSTTYTYYTLSASQLDMHAQGVGGTSPFLFTDPKTPLVFPFGYLDTFTDNFTENGTPDSEDRTYTGYGTVILPTGTYVDVVKMESTSGNIDFFLSDPVSQLVNNNDNGTVLVFGDATTGLPERSAVHTLTAYPNPAMDLVQVSGLGTTGTWTLVDAQGRAQLHGSVRGNTLVLDVAPLASGQYVLVAHDGSTLRRTLITRQ